MNIISYRGPGKPGGVSSSLDQLFRKYGSHRSSWWFVDDSFVSFVQPGRQKTHKTIALNKELLDQHYRFANEFLWPVMHDMPERASYKLSDYKSYFVLNKSIASGLPDAEDGWYFVNDYQFALMPSFLKASATAGGASSFVFWHIPWPRTVFETHIPVLREIVRGMLGAKRIGFHTQEYAHNFMSFVSKFMPAYEVDFEQGQIYSQAEAILRKQAEKRTLRLLEKDCALTEIVVAPLAVDLDYWTNLSAHWSSPLLGYGFQGLTCPFILSADRADYTKGIKERIEAIKLFFEENQNYREQVAFVQICPRTRPGLSQYDSYWQECHDLSKQLLEPLAGPSWNPLIWLEDGISHQDLSLLYKSAEVMLVNPIRDGLNLTAKEFVACQTGKPGALALSSGAGAWHELAPYCLELDPNKPKQMASTILKALNMSPMEKAVRVNLMKDELKQNTFASWCHLIAPEVSHRATRKTLPSSAS